MQLSIIIVNYNVKYFLEQCLCSVNKAIQTLQAEVWVVDNASTDGSLAYLQPRFPWVHFIANKQNVGFAKANNKALLESIGDYVLFLNPDTILPEDCLVRSLEFIKAKNNAGAIGIRMVNGSGKFLPESKRSLPSPASSFYKLTGLSSLFPTSKIFCRYSLGWLDEFKNHEVDILAGAFMLAGRKLLTELKGFDENFFMYGEDVDLSYRIRKRGYKNYYFGESSIIHFKGKSTKKGSLNYIKLFYQAMSIFVKKHYVGTSARLFAYIIQIAIGLRAGISAMISFAAKVRSAFSSYNSQEDEMNDERATIIAGSIQEYNKVKALFTNLGIEGKIAGRITLKREKANALGTIADLDKLIEQRKLKAIIFCEGSISFKEIIETLQKIRPTISVQFFAKGTRSIVGSDSKDISGDVVYLEREMKVLNRAM